MNDDDAVSEKKWPVWLTTLLMALVGIGALFLLTEGVTALYKHIVTTLDRPVKIEIPVSKPDGSTKLARLPNHWIVVKR